jgi:hypothetical protein
VSWLATVRCLLKESGRGRFAASHSRKGIRENTNRRVVQRGKGSPKSVALFVFRHVSPLSPRKRPGLLQSLFAGEDLRP